MGRFINRVFPSETSNVIVGLGMGMFVGIWDLIMILSIMGVFITIIYAFIILRLAIKKNNNKSSVY